MAKMKIGADTGFIGADGGSICVGNKVRHTITGVTGVVDAYGAVKAVDGSRFKLANSIWEVYDYGSKPEIVDDEERVNPMKENLIEKTLADVPDDELLEEVAKRDFGIRRLSEAGVRVFSVQDMEDDELAKELRNRGYDVKAEKTIVVSL